MISGDQKQVGPYAIDRELGRGGMGEVYLARDTRLDRLVAIKVLPAHLAQDPDRLMRFQREAKVLAALNHPAIAAIYGLEEVARQQYLILEYVEGETLADHLKSGPMSVQEALTLAKQISEALESAHEKAIIHRDLKPGNIMVTPDGAAKILDFGLARTTDAAPSAPSTPATPSSPTVVVPSPPHSPTIPGAIMGTAGYMSPEQARGKTVDKRSDIFSFGCVLYEMLSGIGPFRGETVTDSLGAVLHREPNWGLLPAATTPRVRELLGNCLAKDRKSRLHDIGDARLELERAIAGQEWTSAASPKAPRNKLMLTALSAVAALMLIALGVGLRSAFGPGASSSKVTELICVTLEIPPGITPLWTRISRDGRTLVLLDQPNALDGPGAAQPRVFTRRLDSYDFKPMAGTEGASFAAPTRDSRSLAFIAPVSPGAPQRRLAFMPLDGSAPATTACDWKDSWYGAVQVENGDLLILEGGTTFLRLPKGASAPSAPMKLDAGRSGVVWYEITGEALPGDRAFVNVVSYGERGFHYSVGVLDAKTGKVKIIVEDGGSGAYSATGHLLFAHGGVILAAPFHSQSAELRGAPVAVWSGLKTDASWRPALFVLSDRGELFYQPG